jgi:NTP pyrophosphatase (non-canonical NTP hydrolase)
MFTAQALSSKLLNNTMEVKEVQQVVDRWIKDNGVRYFNELTNMAILTEEVGELARIISRKYGEQSFKPSDSNNLSDEIADVFFVLTCIANQTGVDLEEAFRKNIEKKSSRDKERHRQNDKLQK